VKSVWDLYLKGFCLALVLVRPRSKPLSSLELSEEFPPTPGPGTKLFSHACQRVGWLCVLPLNWFWSWAEMGKMTTFYLWPIPWGGGAWGAGTNMWHPGTPASHESLPAPLATQISTLWIHTSGRGGGVSEIRSMSSTRPICKCRCPPLHGEKQLGYRCPSLTLHCSYSVLYSHVL
jgi:hypothetical protein